MKTEVLNPIVMDSWLLNALKEDLTCGDITTEAIYEKGLLCQVKLIAKEEGVLAGIEVFKRVFQLMGEIEMISYVEDGQCVYPGQQVALIKGEVSTILGAERTALNYLQRISGIATLTRSYVEVLKGSKLKLLDTRKTTPGMRLFEKYAVTVGGGMNHRYNLSDGILIKDNHIAAAGGIREAIKKARDYASFVRKIEVEVENLDMVKEALEYGADIIMLDNMNDEALKQAVDLIGDRALTECSGNITKERLSALSEIGIDYVSCGALTHSAKILDFSLKALELI